MIPFIIVLTACVLSGYTFYWIHLSCELSYDKARRKKMNFKNFRSLYAINPERYELRDAVVEMRIIDGMFASYCSPLTIYFSAIGTLRYLWWKRSKISRETEQRSLDVQRAAIELIYKDIAEFEKRNPLLLKGEDLFK